MLALSATDAGGVMDFEQAIEAVAIANAGPNTVYVAFGATAPTASVGDGRYAIASGSYLNLDDLKAQKLAFRCATGETASVQAVGIPVGRVAIGPFGMAVGSGSDSGGDSGDGGAPPPMAGGGQVTTGPATNIPLIIVSIEETVNAKSGTIQTVKEVTPAQPIDISDCQTVACNYPDFYTLGNPDDSYDGNGTWGTLIIEAQLKKFNDDTAYVLIAMFTVNPRYINPGGWYGSVGSFDEDTGGIPAEPVDWVDGNYGYGYCLTNTSAYKELLSIRVSVIGSGFFVTSDPEAEIGQNFRVSGKFCLAFSTDNISSAGNVS